MVRYTYFGIQRISAFLICKFSYFMSFESAIFVKPFLFNTVSDCLLAVKRIVFFTSDVA